MCTCKPGQHKCSVTRSDTHSSWTVQAANRSQKTPVHTIGRFGKYRLTSMTLTSPPCCTINPLLLGSVASLRKQIATRSLVAGLAPSANRLKATTHPASASACDLPETEASLEWAYRTQQLSCRMKANLFLEGSRSFDRTARLLQTRGEKIIYVRETTQRLASVADLHSPSRSFRHVHRLA